MIAAPRRPLAVHDRALRGRVADVNAASRLPVARVGGFGSTERVSAGRRSARAIEHDAS